MPDGNLLMKEPARIDMPLKNPHKLRRICHQRFCGKAASPPNVHSDLSCRSGPMQNILAADLLNFRSFCSEAHQAHTTSNIYGRSFYANMKRQYPQDHDQEREPYKADQAPDRCHTRRPRHQKIEGQLYRKKDNKKKGEQDQDARRCNIERLTFHGYSPSPNI